MKKFIPNLVKSLLLAGICSSGVHANQYNKIKDLSSNDSPASFQLEKSLKHAAKMTVNDIDLKTISKEDLSRERLGQPYRFALPIKHAGDLKQKGRWEISGDTAIWRLTVSGKQAKSFNIGLKNVFLPKGAKLFFYANNSDSIVGPYTHKDNKHHKELWSPTLESNEVTIEINVPTTLKQHLSFDIAQISQGYRGIRLTEVAKSGSCNNDVICSEADAWRNEIRSVARYTINIDGSSFLCTGTLMNNTKDDLKPIFLTAGHCGVSPTTSSTMVIYWNYETSACGGTPDGQLNQFQTGTTFLAGTDPSGVVDSDFAVVELDSAPSASHNVYWAGWDRSENNSSASVAIHHPSGDEKRISFDNDPTTITNYSSNTIVASGTHLRIGEWEDGTTEGGSSGSGLWNPEHRLVGTLSGGSASCQALDAPDWYGRLSTHWEGDGTTDGQAKVWLDPDSTGAMTLDGRNSCDAPVVSIDTSPATGVIGESLSFSASASGGSGSYTYTWDFNQDALDDATGSSLSFTYNYLFQGNITVTATDSSGCPGTDTAALVISNAGDELFPQDGAIPGDWSTSAGANAGWSVDSVTKFEGASAIKSDSVIDEQQADIEVTQTFDDPNENFVSFAYKVSSEQGYDKLVFSIDGDQKGSWSGEVDWSVAYYNLEAGSHTLKWSYVKDQSVSDGQDAAWIDGVTGITFPLANNNAPVAAVANSALDIGEGEDVTLDASASSDADGDALTFLWEQTDGETATITNADMAIATVTAPSVVANSVLTFRVTVTDVNNISDTETVIINVADSENNDSPIASVANVSIEADEETLVTLDASSSSDPNGDTLTYLWTQPGGSTLSLQNANSAIASFTAPRIDRGDSVPYRFTITVTDESGAQDSIDVTVTVNNVEDEPLPEEESGGGGGSSLLMLFTLALLVRKRIFLKIN